MSNLKTILPKTEPALVAESPKEVAEDPRQRGLMVGSLCLLLLALGIVLWHDRDFWFPDSPDEAADDAQPVEASPIANSPRELALVAKLATTKPNHKALHAPSKTESASTT